MTSLFQCMNNFISTSCIILIEFQDQSSLPNKTPCVCVCVCVRDNKFDEQHSFLDNTGFQEILALLSVRQISEFQRSSPWPQWTPVLFLHWWTVTFEAMYSSRSLKERHRIGFLLQHIFRPAKRVQEVLQDQQHQLHQRHAWLYPFSFNYRFVFGRVSFPNKFSFL